jgi:hypothetical protein
MNTKTIFTIVSLLAAVVPILGTQYVSACHGHYGHYGRHGGHISAMASSTSEDGGGGSMPSSGGGY